MVCGCLAACSVIRGGRKLDRLSANWYLWGVDFPVKDCRVDLFEVAVLDDIYCNIRLRNNNGLSTIFNV